MLLLAEYQGLDIHWKLVRIGSCRSGFYLEIGPGKIRICFKKWSGFGPILENIGPIHHLVALLVLANRLIK